MAGFRSPLPILGLAASEQQAGFRSLLAPWIGGASSIAPTQQAGFRGLLAFWAGGAAAGPDATPPRRILYLPQVADRRRIDEEDEALLLGGALN